MFSTTSVFLLVAVAYDRYVAVCRPLSLQRRIGSPLVQGIVRAAICWLVASMVSFPEPLIHRMMADSEISRFCM
jgi:7 transmembrane receptor (rhodopsin family)